MFDPPDDAPHRAFRFRRVTAVMRWLHIYLSMLGFLALLFFAVTGLTLNHPDWFSLGVERVERFEGAIDPQLLGASPYYSSEQAGPATRIVPATEAAPPPEEHAPAIEQAPPSEEPPPVTEAAPLELAPTVEAPPSPSQTPSRAANVLSPNQAARSEATVNREAVVALLRTRHHISGAVADVTVDPSQCIVLFKGPAYAADAFIDRTSGRYDLTVRRQDWVALINDLHKGRNTGPAWSWVVDISAVVMTISAVTGLVLLLASRKRRRAGLVATVAGSLIVILVYLLLVP